MNAPISTTAYADDIVFFASDKAILHGVFARIEAYLRDRLRLQIKGNWQIFPIANNRYDKHGSDARLCGLLLLPPTSRPAQEHQTELLPQGGGHQ